jgi:hypothetical protein
MENKIIEIGVDNSVIIRPTMFIFPLDNTKSNGFIAYDNERRVFFYPIFSDPTSEPVTFLHECLLQAGNDFKNMMKFAYMKRKYVIIGKRTVYWQEYENMFSKQTFYTKSEEEEASVVDMSNLTFGEHKTS